jgi:hypothetical protein
MGVGGQRHAPATLPQGKRPGTHFIGGWVGPRKGAEYLAPPPATVLIEKFDLMMDNVRTHGSVDKIRAASDIRCHLRAISSRAAPG